MVEQKIIVSGLDGYDSWLFIYDPKDRLPLKVGDRVHTFMGMGTVTALGISNYNGELAAVGNTVERA